MNDIESSKGGVEAVMAAGAARGTPVDIHPNFSRVNAYIIPQGYKLEVPRVNDAEQWMLRPLWKSGIYEFADADSFQRYFNEHKNADSRIFADINDNGATYTGFLDFHGENPSFNRHKCAFSLQPTKEWQTWMQFNKQAMEQEKFALFLEENEDLFKDPSGALLREIVETLEGKSHVDINTAVRLKNGMTRISYNEEVELKGGGAGSKAGDMEVPSMLTVSITPFVGVGYYDIQARLRYRINNRKISFWYETVAAHLVVRAVSAKVTQLITEKTGLVPFLT